MAVGSVARLEGELLEDLHHHLRVAYGVALCVSERSDDSPEALACEAIVDSLAKAKAIVEGKEVGHD